MTRRLSSCDAPAGDRRCEARALGGRFDDHDLAFRVDHERVQDANRAAAQDHDAIERVRQPFGQARGVQCDGDGFGKHGEVEWKANRHGEDVASRHDDSLREAPVADLAEEAEVSAELRAACSTSCTGSMSTCS